METAEQKSGWFARLNNRLKGTGDSFGMDLSEAIFIPVASAQSMFNVHGLFRVLMKV